MAKMHCVIRITNHATGLLAVLLLTSSPARAVSPAADKFFEDKIRPMLVQHCYRCHSLQARKERGGLRVDSLASLLEGGDSGPAIVPGKPEESLLLKAIRHEDDLAMPPKDKLPA